jgi:hypothetical protein
MDQEVFNYAKSRYDEEQLRFDHIENKCGKFVSFITIAIATLSGIIGFYKDTLFSPCGLMDWSIFIVGCAAFISLFCSWGHALLTIKLGTSKVAPKNDETINYLLSADTSPAREHIFKCYIETARKIKLSYKELAISGGLLALLILLTAIKEMTQ